MHSARLETRVVLETMLDHLPDLRPDADARDAHIGGDSFRALLELPVVFDTR